MSDPTSEDLADLMIAALVAGVAGQTIAGPRVYAASAWPTVLPIEPYIVFEPVDEDKVSAGLGAPQFNTTAIIVLHGRVTAAAQAADGAANAVRQVLKAFRRQIEVAVINDYALTRSVSSFASVRSRIKTEDSGRQLVGEVAVEFRLAFYQGPELFHPAEADPIDEVRIYADLVNVADPSGTYTPPFDYPVTNAPRSAGPDGRIEGQASASNLQD